MKKISILLIALVATLCSCTNNGDIGHYYGAWVFDSLYIGDSEPTDVDYTDYVIKFQNNIVQINYKLGWNDFVSYTGTWQQDADVLKLNFTATKVALELEQIGLSTDRVVDMLVVEQTSTRMVLSFVDDEGQAVHYVLRKLR